LLATIGSLLRHPVSIAGVLITTVGAVGFLTMAVAAALGLFNHPYAGLIVFILLPAVFVLGLLLIPLGIRLHRRAIRRDPAAADWPVVDLRKANVRRTVLAVTALTVINGMIVLLAGYGGLHWMESPSFCGQACHTPMHPQYTAWQNTTHANIACVDCHVGEGGRALVKYKLAGVRQLVHVITNNYPRPIPASQADLRPALETCGTCHTASMGHGVRPRMLKQYGDDEANTETVTNLELHVGGPGQPTPSGRAIHWHADPAVRVEYVTTDADRQAIPFVRVVGRSGEVKEYVVEGTTPESLGAGATRVMDCIDCHNAAAHRISPTAEEAVDRALAAGEINPKLPFVRREGVLLLKSGYTSEEEAVAAIDSGLRAFYKDQAQVDAQALSLAVQRLQRLYRTNVFPTMNVTWGVYRDNLGHTTSDGCFRCHDGSHVAKDGSTISADCEYCHTMR
jgi:nitrate/TMAO reductase-like tetraheme cytochrome c subunit